eukprot:Opistho-1_new@39620
MYFTHGWPRVFEANDGSKSPLIAVRCNLDGSLFLALSASTVYLWEDRPRALVATVTRSKQSIEEHGENVDVVWKFDSTVVAVTTSKDHILFFEDISARSSSTARVYTLTDRGNSSFVASPGMGEGAWVREHHLRLRGSCNIKDGITCAVSQREGVVVATVAGVLLPVRWSCAIDSEDAVALKDVQFRADADPMPENVIVSAMDYKKSINCFGIVLSDGRAMCVVTYSSGAKKGYWVAGVANATMVTVNAKFRLVAVGCEGGDVVVCQLDDVAQELRQLHWLTIPAESFPHVKPGPVSAMAWSADGRALAVAWRHCGLSVWSAFGSLLFCTLGYSRRSCDTETPADTRRLSHCGFHSISWGREGYSLLAVPICETTDGTAPAAGQNGAGARRKADIATGSEIVQFSFVKSALVPNPVASNHNRLLLHGEDRIFYFAENGFPIDPAQPKASDRLSDLQWQTVQLPLSYLVDNWPIRLAAVSDGGQFVAVAGRTGLAQYAIGTRRWKLFGNQNQEREISCKTLAWWRDFIVVGCRNALTGTDELRWYPRSSPFDNASIAHAEALERALVLVNVHGDHLIVYTNDRTLTVCTMHNDSENEVDVRYISTVILADHIPPGVSVTSIALTTLFIEQGTRGPLTLLANVAGKVLMFDLPVLSMRGMDNEVVMMSSPSVLASSVESLWIPPHSANQNRRHLSEAICMGCGSQGMKVWLPLFCDDENNDGGINGLYRRIMVSFSLDFFPLCTYFADAVVFGIVEEASFEHGDATTGFPFCVLEQKTFTYLHHILRQLLRRGMDRHAVAVARSCMSLPYFGHALELILHEVLEAEAETMVGFRADALLPRVVDFLGQFPQFLEVIVHCARKTEVALWDYLFSIVGEPATLFDECLATKRFKTAASYLLILQALEPTSVSEQYAARLLETAMDNDEWELSRDLVRFLGAIADDEPGVPLNQSSDARPSNMPPVSGNRTLDALRKAAAATA